MQSKAKVNKQQLQVAQHETKPKRQVQVKEDLIKLRELQKLAPMTSQAIKTQNLSPSGQAQSSKGSKNSGAFSFNFKKNFVEQVQQDSFAVSGSGPGQKPSSTRSQNKTTTLDLVGNRTLASLAQPDSSIPKRLKMLLVQTQSLAFQNPGLTNPQLVQTVKQKKLTTKSTTGGDRPSLTSKHTDQQEAILQLSLQQMRSQISEQLRNKTADSKNTTVYNQVKSSEPPKTLNTKKSTSKKPERLSLTTKLQGISALVQQAAQKTTGTTTNAASGNVKTLFLSKNARGSFVNEDIDASDFQAAKRQAGSKISKSIKTSFTADTKLPGKAVSSTRNTGSKKSKPQLAFLDDSNPLPDEIMDCNGKMSKQTTLNYKVNEMNLLLQALQQQMTPKGQYLPIQKDESSRTKRKESSSKKKFTCSSGDISSGVQMSQLTGGKQSKPSSEKLNVTQFDHEQIEKIRLEQMNGFQISAANKRMLMNRSDGSDKSKTDDDDLMADVNSIKNPQLNQQQLHNLFYQQLKHQLLQQNRQQQHSDVSDCSEQDLSQGPMQIQPNLSLPSKNLTNKPAHAQYFADTGNPSAKNKKNYRTTQVPTSTSNSTAITTQVGNTVININIDNGGRKHVHQEGAFSPQIISAEQHEHLLRQKQQYISNENNMHYPPTVSIVPAHLPAHLQTATHKAHKNHLNFVFKTDSNSSENISLPVSQIQLAHQKQQVKKLSKSTAKNQSSQPKNANSTSILRKKKLGKSVPTVEGTEKKLKVQQRQRLHGLIESVDDETLEIFFTKMLQKGAASPNQLIASILATKAARRNAPKSRDTTDLESALSSARDARDAQEVQIMRYGVQMKKEGLPKHVVRQSSSNITTSGVASEIVNSSQVLLTEESCYQPSSNHTSTQQQLQNSIAGQFIGSVNKNLPCKKSFKSTGSRRQPSNLSVTKKTHGRKNSSLSKSPHHLQQQKQVKKESTKKPKPPVNSFLENLTTKKQATVLNVSGGSGQQIQHKRLQSLVTDAPALIQANCDKQALYRQIKHAETVKHTKKVFKQDGEVEQNQICFNQTQPLQIPNSQNERAPSNQTSDFQQACNYQDGKSPPINKKGGRPDTDSSSEQQIMQVFPGQNGPKAKKGGLNFSGAETQNQQIVNKFSSFSNQTGPLTLNTNNEKMLYYQDKKTEPEQSSSALFQQREQLKQIQMRTQDMTNLLRAINSKSDQSQNDLESSITEDIYDPEQMETLPEVISSKKSTPLIRNTTDMCTLTEPDELTIIQQPVPSSKMANNFIPDTLAKETPRQLLKPAKKEDAIDPVVAFPISVRETLKLFAKTGKLTDYEKTELLGDFKEVYCIGIVAANQKTKIDAKPGKKFNYGYDDVEGDYQVVVGDHIAYRYEVLGFLGRGSFGQALKCMDHKTSEIVCLKVIRNKKKFQHQATVELKILQHLTDQDPEDTNNIIQLKDHCVFRSHMVITFDMFSINLFEYIQNRQFAGVPLALIRRFAIQILQALKYLKEEQIIHCDLKPENILLKSPDKSGIKIIDFGSSCFSHQRIYTYIQSRYYRAPEIILGIPYTTAIDMWSFGCILAELYTGSPIFPGESEQEQLALIMEIFGQPPARILEKAGLKHNFFDENLHPLYGVEDSDGKLRIPGTKAIEDVLGNESASFLKFIKQCLIWDPEQRIQPLQALQHTWIVEGLPPEVLIHHQRMLELDVPSSSEHSQSCSHILPSNSQSRADQLGESLVESFVEEERDPSPPLNQQLSDCEESKDAFVPHQSQLDRKGAAAGLGGADQKALDQIEIQNQQKQQFKLKSNHQLQTGAFDLSNTQPVPHNFLTSQQAQTTKAKDTQKLHQARAAEQNQMFFKKERQPYAGEDSEAHIIAQKLGLELQQQKSKTTNMSDILRKLNAEAASSSIPAQVKKASMRLKEEQKQPPFSFLRNNYLKQTSNFNSASSGHRQTAEIPQKSLPQRNNFFSDFGNSN